jgi:L-alanine-DL-glutamate epimerase-like enolase superfamily enzyme
MKITDLRLRQVTGTMRHEGAFWEERLIQPLDVYPEHRALTARANMPGWRHDAEGDLPITAVFVQVETDEGAIGIGGPITHEVAYIIDRQFRHLLGGEDPRATERLWDKMYRQAVHGRKGATMMAISVLDCALWDLRGRWAGQPVYRLLGGPVRTAIPAYASALGYAIEPERAAARAGEFVAQGYRATKWFVRDGPTDGREGLRRNVELVRALREAVGPDVDIMIDAWMSWDVPYTLRMAEALAEYDPRWIEEPVLPDKVGAYAAIRGRSRVPIAGGEHEYTRWGLKGLMDAGAVDVLQPDIYWAGGISELVKICALASTYDLPVIPHGHSTPATAHLIAAMPVTLCPLLEYLIKWNAIHQFFLASPLQPVDGVVTVPDSPGLGMDLDPAKITDERELRWDG